MRLPRRTFLRYAATATSAPAWLAAAFAQEPRDAPEPAPLVREALERARASGRPLLLIVVPEQEEDEHEPLRRSRMLFWGRLLHNATRAGVQDLALCELAAAPRSDLARTLAPRVLPAGAALAFLVETEAREPEVRAIDPELPLLPDVPLGYPPPEEGLAALEEAVHAQIAAFEVALREHLLPRAGALAARASQAERARGSDEPRSFAAARLALERALAPAPEDLRALLARARAHVTGGAAPLGAAWGVYEPCGVRIDGHSSRSPGVGCGLGFVPSISSRFLAFYVRERDQR
jgi:hypothetical protein